MSVRSIFTNIASMLGGAIEHVSPGFGVAMKKLNTNWSEVDFHTAYNIWLEDYLLQGRYISHFYDYPQPRIEVVSDPESQRPILQMACVALSLAITFCHPKLMRQNGQVNL